MRMNAIAENALVDGWWSILRRHPRQRNAPHESDAELIDAGGQVLALTTDTIAEECACGLYTEPETIGWMAAMVSLSDLAAVGAEPLGLLVAATLPDPSAQAGIARGLEAACRAAGTWVLGGDTNFGPAISITSTAVGVAPRPLTRVGCRPGDRVFITGRPGLGACCAARALLEYPFPEAQFRPAARLAEGVRLRGLATACMDTSDGLLAAVDQLARLNGVGFEITTPLAGLLDPRALEMCLACGLPPLLALAQQHGEFELVFTAPPDRAGEAAGFVEVGIVTECPAIEVEGRTVDTTRIRNALEKAGGDPRTYLELLRGML